MSTLQEIKRAIEALSPQERAELERLLHEPTPSTVAAHPLPDQASRRRRIFGDKVLPNMVIEAREAESA